MNFKCITAVVPVEILSTLEQHLRGCGIPGITVETVLGYGKHPNYFRRDLMQDNARLILYTVDEKVQEIIDALAACAHECGIQTGIVSVHSVERLVHLADGSNVSPASLQE